MPAAERLKDPRVNYLLVTSADVDGAARKLRLGNFGERPKTTELPPTIATVVPANSAGRIGLLASADPERVAYKLQELLEDAFRVPRSNLAACKEALSAEARERMRGIGGGVWTQDELAHVREHNGYATITAPSYRWCSLSWSPVWRWCERRN